MLRTELIRRLEDLDPLTPEAAFVLLWSYFEAGGLATAENLARSKYIHPLDIKPYSSREGLLRTPEELRSSTPGEGFDLLALQWLIALDLLLNARKIRRFEDIPLSGLTDRRYRLRRRNDYLATQFQPGVTWEADQSGSLATYTRFHKAVPAEPIAGIHIECRSESSWGDRRLHYRLLKERNHLRIMLWPLRLVLDYPVLDALKAGTLPTLVCLDQVRNEADLQAEVREAIETARDRKVTLLVFPELAIPTGTEDVIRSTLKVHGRLGHPILTLFGRCHRPNDKGDLDRNDAILLGPDGTELHRHQKLAAYTGFNEDRSAYFGERLEVGDTVTVLESALGNLAPLICLDLLHLPLAPILRQSHANLLPVPSLSAETGAHRTAAKQLQVSNRAGTFVCNRWISGVLEAGTSFYQVPRSGGYKAHLPDPDGSPYLLFELT